VTAIDVREVVQERIRPVGSVDEPPARVRDDSGRAAPREVTVVAISSLLPADSPRLSGEDTAHTRRLAESTTALPPILVHRATRRVIDGMHRLRAAVLNGRDKIEVEFFDGSEETAFLLAVERNVAHGLPLSLAERRAAAERIIVAHPERSDRAIAASAGLSDKTVAAIRRRSTSENPHLNTRLGRDGRAHPLRVAEGRRRAGEVIAARPDASLREIAKAAGISAGTAQDVRERLRQGKDPVLPERQAASSSGRPVVTDPSPQPVPRLVVEEAKDSLARLQTLKRDPCLRFSEAGRNLLRWLHAQVIGTRNWAEMVDTVPPHSVGAVADLAMECAEAWRDFAEELHRRSRNLA
jgi:ParB-like chromosome segregation protein Spo0J